MRPSYHPRLVNNPFEDAGLFVSFLLDNRAILFDLGDIHSLSPRDILKITHVFVSHTHMDHFIGFDHLIRFFLGREKELHLFGPSGFLKNVEGKLAGYTWNLVNSYTYRFALKVTEVDSGVMRTKRYQCQNRFQPDEPAMERPFNGTLLSEPAFSIISAVFDHKVDSLGFSLSERFHINILKAGLDRLKLPVGPWLKKLKENLYAGLDPGSPFEIPSGEDGGGMRRFKLKELADQVALITPGQKITYIADAAGNSSNLIKMIDLASRSHHLFIETHFLEQDRPLADETHHLTAHMAGSVAREAGVRQCTPFHFSPRYTGSGHLLVQEVADAAGPDIAVNSWSAAF
ncbi:MAG: ribonuclease Z [Pseudomonadota bacterium]